MCGQSRSTEVSPLPGPESDGPRVTSLPVKHRERESGAKIEEANVFQFWTALLDKTDQSSEVTANNDVAARVADLPSLQTVFPYPSLELQGERDLMISGN